MIKIQKEHTVLKTQGLTIGYHSKLEDIIVGSNIDFSLNKSELVGLVGANGIGKSTLLRTLTGMQSSLEGKIIIKGIELSSLDPSELAKCISVVLTEPTVTKNLSVYELVALGRQPYTNWVGHLTQTDLKAIDNALTLANIDQFKNKKCFELSDGQLQNVMIARALAQDTEIIVLDEPTTHLDIHHRAYVFNLLRQLANETKKTILFSTHEIDLAIQLCDKLMVMTCTSLMVDTPQNHIDKHNFDELFPKGLVEFHKETQSFRIKK